MYVNRPVASPYYQVPVRPAAYQVPGVPTSTYNTSQATSDVVYNIKALATNVWTWLKGFLQSAVSTLQSATQPHA